MSISFAAPTASDQSTPDTEPPSGPPAVTVAPRTRWWSAPRNALPAESVSVPHVGALDGLRGLAVIAVLAYHQHKLSGGFDAARGGYLGVSAFFTLSGYLITNLLVAEHESPGGDRAREVLDPPNPAPPARGRRRPGPHCVVRLGVRAR